MRHTPGPWTWRNAWVSSDGMLNPRRLAGPNEVTVVIPNVETDLRISREDGNLIAAAPELLDACCGLLRHWLGEKKMLANFIRENPESDIAKAAAAIAKATGERQ